MSDVKAKLSGMKQELDLRFMHTYQKLEEIRERLRDVENRIREAEDRIGRAEKRIWPRVGSPKPN